MFSLPVVATRWRGFPEMVLDEETGLLVAPGDDQELARALRRVLEDQTMRATMGARGRRRYETSFTIERHVEAMERELLRVGRTATGGRSVRAKGLLRESSPSGGCGGASRSSGLPSRFTSTPCQSSSRRSALSCARRSRGTSSCVSSMPTGRYAPLMRQRRGDYPRSRWSRWVWQAGRDSSTCQALPSGSRARSASPFMCTASTPGRHVLVDYRDHPDLYGEGDFQMDVGALQSVLPPSVNLHLGPLFVHGARVPGRARPVGSNRLLGARCRLLFLNRRRSRGAQRRSRQVRVDRHRVRGRHRTGGAQHGCWGAAGYP